jgi:hypothetical protein
VVCFDEKRYWSFFFQEPTIIGDIFLVIMENTALCHVPVERVFELDGTLPHFCCCVHAFLGSVLITGWGKGGPISWPPHSPDLTPLDIFWVFVTDCLS